MNKTLTALLATALCCFAYTAMAADPPDTTNIGNSDTPQQAEQSDMTSPSKPMHMPHMGMNHSSSKELKMMDSDNDGSVSKDEFLAYEGQRYDNMHKDSDGNVPIKGMMKKNINTSSNSNY